MRFIQDLPIRRKLLLVTMATCSAALVLVCSVLFWFQSVTFRRSFAAELHTLGTVVAQNSAAPLAFDDRKSALEVLSALKVNPDITSACVFDARDRAFVSLGEEGERAGEAGSSAGRVVFDHGFAQLSLPIPLPDGPPGRLFLRAAFARKYRDVISLCSGVMAAALLGAIIVIVSVTSVLQGIITRPIVALSDAVRNVIEKNDYATRAEASGADEVALLTQTFNDMLDRIQSRDRRLHEHQDDLRRSLLEKETLLREIHHRVKNNLQIISGLLYFHGKKSREPEALALFENARTRLRSMILVHEKLYNSHDLAAVDFGDYVRSLVAEFSEANAGLGRRIRFTVETVPIQLPIGAAVPAGMILVELITNVVKYAYPDQPGGEAVVRLAADNGRVQLTVCDYGAGMPAGFDPRGTVSFGWKLITNLTAQLDGSCAIRNGTGTEITISFPLSDP